MRFFIILTLLLFSNINNTYSFPEEPIPSNEIEEEEVVEPLSKSPLFQDNHLTLYFIDQDEFDLTLGILHPQQIEETTHLTLFWTGWNILNWGQDKQAVNFEQLAVFENLQKLEIKADYQLGQSGQFVNSPSAIESLLTLPQFENIEEILISKLVPLYKENPFEVEIYPIGMVEAFLLKINQYEKLRTLQLSDGFFWGSFRKFSDGIASYLDQIQLEELNVSENGWASQYRNIYYTDVLKDLSQLASLRKLDLSSGPFLRENDIIEIGNIQTLQSLKLNNGLSIGNEILAPLPNLKELIDLSPYNKMRYSGPFIQAYPELQKFEGLINENSYPSLMDINQHPKLTEIKIDRSDFTAESIEQFNHTHFPSLLRLSMVEVKVRGASWITIAPNLEVLILANSSVGGKDIQEISQLVGLQELDLSHTKISGSAVNKLKNLTQLKTLNLAGNNLKNAQFDSLAQLLQLEFLGLNGSELLIDDLEGLKELKQLKILNLNRIANSNITREDILKIVEALPNTLVIHSY